MDTKQCTKLQIQDKFVGLRAIGKNENEPQVLKLSFKQICLRWVYGTRKLGTIKKYEQKHLWNVDKFKHSIST